MLVEVGPFGSATIAICVFFVGLAIVSRVAPLRTFGIPESVVGGLAAALVITIVYYGFDFRIVFDIDQRDLFLAYFFSALGLRSKLSRVLANGWPLFVLIFLASLFILLQNGVGVAIASAFDLHPKLGIVAGSMALTGRSGTTIAWAPLFQEQFGLDNVSRVGLGANVLGLIAACAIGGPIAKFLVRRHQLGTPGQSADLDVGISKDAPSPQLDYRAFLLAILRIHMAIIAGQAFDLGLVAVGVEMPIYVSCLGAGILLGNVLPRITPRVDFAGSDQCLSLIADITLGLFYTMTIMNLQLWNTEGLLDFLLVMVVIQAAVAALYAVFVVYPVMGRDYEAAVMSAGFAGLSMGSTASTMAIMTAVAKQFGRAPRAFVIVPVACGFFIDIVNSLLLALFAAL